MQVTKTHREEKIPRAPTAAPDAGSAAFPPFPLPAKPPYHRACHVPSGPPPFPTAAMARRDVAIAALLALVLAAFLIPAATLGVDQHHDGVMLKPALDVLSGQALFRDTFTQYGALTTYLQVAVLWFSPTLTALRYSTVVAYVVTMLLLYASWRIVLPRSLAVLSGLLFILFIPAYEKTWLQDYWMMLPWSSVYALMFQSLGLYALLNLIRHRQALRWSVVLGVACACVLWCRQPVGVVMTGSVAACWLALWGTGWTPQGVARGTLLRGLVAGFLVVNIALLGSLVLTDAVPQWWYQNFVWPSRWAQQYDSVSLPGFFGHFLRSGGGVLLLLLGVLAPGGLARLGVAVGPRHRVAWYAILGLVFAWQHELLLRWLALRESAWTLLLPLFVLLLAVGGLALAFRKPNGPRPAEYYLVAAWGAVAAGSLLQYYPVPDPLHAIWALAPGFGLVTYLFWRASGWAAPVATVVLAGFFLPAAADKLRVLQQVRQDALVTLDRPALLRGMRVPPKEARGLLQVADLVDRVQGLRPDMPGVLIGDDALYLSFLRNRTNPTPYFVTWRLLGDAASSQQRYDYIQRVRPLLFLHKARWDAVSDFYRRARYLPVLYVESEALEVALPQELADALGLKLYSASAPAEPAQPDPHP